jgi:glutamate-1-semialdehyde 2,1-aminomutase
MNTQTTLTLETAQEKFTERFKVSAKMTEDNRKAIPGGYSRTTFNFGPHAIYAREGKGAYIETVDGHRLLDLNNNFTVNILGHSHEALQEAITAALPTGISFGNPVEEERRLADLLIDRMPSIELVRFTCSATEAAMGAVRIARAYTGKTKIAKFEGGYHGFSDTLSVSGHVHPDHDHGPDDAPKSTPESGGTPQSVVNDVVVLPQNDIEASAKILRENATDLACLIMELESGAGGVITLDTDFVKELRELTQELGIVLIFDETITLRAGYHGLQGEMNVAPDMTVMGKIIGGGFPLGAIGGSGEIMRVLEDGRANISGTHHGHKLSLVAGIACMEALTEEILDDLNAKAERIMSEVNAWAKERDLPFTVFGYGFSHLGYAYLKDVGLPLKNHRHHLTHIDGEKTQTVSLELANRGFFPVHRGEFSLSTPMTDEDIDSFIETLKAIVTEIG